MKRRIVVGLSGGVDSALVAALLQERGCDVLGVYLEIALDATGHRTTGACPSREDLRIAQRVAAHLDIPFHVVDATDAYEREVLAPFVAAYARGETPSPDIPCNRLVKFPLLLAAADRLGCLRIATGHYARVIAKSASRDGAISVELHRAIDASKDQSYFLWQLTEEQLQRVDFPLGTWTKAAVREEARKRRLPNWDRRSTTGVCFLQGIDIGAYLEERMEPVRASVVTTTGVRLGTVDHAAALTIGQRIPIGGLPEPRYVVAKDLNARRLTVTAFMDDPALFTQSCHVREVQWIGNAPALPRRNAARYRNLQDPVDVQLSPTGDARIAIAFSEPQRAVTPGQAMVFLDGDRVLGGGIIDTHRSSC